MCGKKRDHSNEEQRREIKEIKDPTELEKTKEAPDAVQPVLIGVPVDADRFDELKRRARLPDGPRDDKGAQVDSGE